MKSVGIERSASDIHRPIAHGLKTRAPRRTKQAQAVSVQEACGAKGSPKSCFVTYSPQYVDTPPLLG